MEADLQESYPDYIEQYMDSVKNKYFQSRVEYEKLMNEARLDLLSQIYEANQELDVENKTFRTLLGDSEVEDHSE